MCIDLTERLATDLEGAFPDLVHYHADLVYGVALRVTRNTADAEEVTQDVFLRAHRAIAGYEADRIRDLRLRGWLARIALNLARNQLRRRPPGAEPIDTIVEPRTSDHDGPERKALRREGARSWAALLDRLPADYRSAVSLRHVEGLSYPELAVALDRPIGTVKTHVHRGVRLLRAAYEAETSRTGPEGTEGAAAGRPRTEAPLRGLPTLRPAGLPSHATPPLARPSTAGAAR